MLKNQKSSNRKLLIIGLTAVTIVGIVGVSYWIFVLRPTKNSTVEEAKTTSTAPTAQEDFTGGDDRTPNQSTSNDEGTLSDNNGVVSTTPPQSSWTNSSDGKITVYTPSSNALISSGQELSGKSSYQKVNFRLIDDATGVIMEGNIAVVNGQFSGKLNFNSSGTNGRLDLFYSTNASPESSNIEIPVRFR